MGLTLRHGLKQTHVERLQEKGPVNVCIFCHVQFLKQLVKFAYTGDFQDIRKNTEVQTLCYTSVVAAARTQMNTVHYASTIV